MSIGHTHHACQQPEQPPLCIMVQAIVLAFFLVRSCFLYCMSVHEQDAFKQRRVHSTLRPCSNSDLRSSCLVDELFNLDQIKSWSKAGRVKRHQESGPVQSRGAFDSRWKLNSNRGVYFPGTLQQRRGDQAAARADWRATCAVEWPPRLVSEHRPRDEEMPRRHWVDPLSWGESTNGRCSGTHAQVPLASC